MVEGIGAKLAVEEKEVELMDFEVVEEKISEQFELQKQLGKEMVEGLFVHAQRCIEEYNCIVTMAAEYGVELYEWVEEVKTTLDAIPEVLDEQTPAWGSELPSNDPESEEAEEEQEEEEEEEEPVVSEEPEEEEGLPVVEEEVVVALPPPAVVVEEESFVAVVQEVEEHTAEVVDIRSSVAPEPA